MPNQTQSEREKNKSSPPLDAACRRVTCLKRLVIFGRAIRQFGARPEAFYLPAMQVQLSEQTLTARPPSRTTPLGTHKTPQSRPSSTRPFLTNSPLSNEASRRIATAITEKRFGRRQRIDRPGTFRLIETRSALFRAIGPAMCGWTGALAPWLSWFLGFH